MLVQGNETKLVVSLFCCRQVMTYDNLRLVTDESVKFVFLTYT